jgi:hypothetical protein
MVTEVTLAKNKWQVKGPVTGNARTADAVTRRLVRIDPHKLAVFFAVPLAGRIL